MIKSFLEPNFLSKPFSTENPSCNNDFFLSEAQKRNNPVNDGTYTFIRKAKVGTYKEELSPHVIKRIEDWTKESLKSTGFKFRC